MTNKQTNKQTKEYGQSRTLEPRSRASEKENSITHSGRAGLSLSKTSIWRSPLERPAACSPDSWSGALYVGATLCSGGGWRPGGPPSVAVIVVPRRARGACVRVERATPRAAPRESAIAPRALGLIPGQRTVALPRGVAAAVAAPPGCRSRSRVPPDRGAHAEGDVEFGLCGAPPQEHLPFAMRGVSRSRHQTIASKRVPSAHLDGVGVPTFEL